MSDIKVTIIPPVHIESCPFTRPFAEIHYARQRGQSVQRVDITKHRKLDWRKCGICGAPHGTVTLVRDHDHRTGYIRGILCNLCNSWLGLFESRRGGKRRYKRWVKKYQAKIIEYLSGTTGILYPAHFWQHNERKKNKGV